MKLLKIALIMLCIAASPNIQGQNCSNTAVGLVPIMDLGTNTFQGMQGGLYNNGQNDIPTPHLQQGLALASSIQPLNTSGNPAANGAIVFLSIGMSNANQFFGSFRDSSMAYTNRHPRLRLLNGAQGGKDIENLLNPNDSYWTTLDQIITNSNASHQQVQAIWFMQAVHITKIPQGQGVEHIDSVENKFLRVFRMLKARFPNLKQLYCSGRDYGGYSLPARGNPEPYAYYTGWAFRKLVDRQMAGDAELAFLGAQASVPWLAWASYMWADGTTPRSDGFNWVCPDFEPDGVHPNNIGRGKGAHLLMNFFKQAPTASWYRAANLTGIATKHQRAFGITYAQDGWQITHTNATNPQWELLDLSGKILFSGQSKTIKYSLVNPGTYVLRIRHENNYIRTTRIVN